MSIPEKGTRIRLLSMGDDPDPIPVGAEGTVTYVNRWGSLPDSTQIAVDWDNGRSLMLLAGVDRWQVIA